LIVRRKLSVQLVSQPDEGFSNEGSRLFDEVFELF
jgi:hypothetical protein